VLAIASIVGFTGPMAKTTKLIPAGSDDRAEAALVWLAGQLRWEQTLERLHHHAEASLPEARPERDARAA
jgi:hypothetical protein